MHNVDVFVDYMSAPCRHAQLQNIPCVMCAGRGRFVMRRISIVAHA